MGGGPQRRVSRETSVATAESFLRAASLDGSRAGRLTDLAEALAGVAVERGFIAPGDADRLLERHVLDGVRASPYLPAEGSVADVGSGAGIPGLPLAIVAPSLRFVLIEPRQARVAFLESTVDRLGLANVDVVHGRVETVPDASYDAALARAFAPLERAWATIRPKLRAGGELVFYAGENTSEPSELAGAAMIRRHGPDAAAAAVLERSGPLIIITAQ